MNTNFYPGSVEMLMLRLCESLALFPRLYWPLLLARSDWIGVGKVSNVWQHSATTIFVTSDFYS